MDKVGRYEFTADAFHCDFGHRLFMGHLGNHMLNAADFHSSERGFGMRYLNTVNKTWVLSRLSIEMDEMPAEGDRFFVETWVESAMRFFTNRNFRVVSPEGKVYGYGRSVWAMIDTVTRQPQDILAIHDGEIKEWIESGKECPIGKPSRVKMGDGAKLESSFIASYNDIDVNGHLNSVKYIEHVLDLFSLDWYSTHRLSRIDVAYVAEAHYGDKINLYTEGSALEKAVRVAKVADDGSETEVCRVQVRFELKKR